MFTADTLKHCVILKLVEKREFRFQIQLFFQSSLSCVTQGLSASWVTTAGIRPVFGPKRFEFTPLLEQDFTVVIKQEN